MTTPNPTPERTEDGGPAFPFPHPDAYATDSNKGMSLRDWFAGQAMAAFISNKDLVLALAHEVADSGDTTPAIAQIAFEYADAMLKARAAR